MRPIPRFLFFLLAAGYPFLQGAEPAPSPQHILNTDPSEKKRMDALSKLEKANSLDARQISRSIADTAPRIRAAVVRIGAQMAVNDPELELRLIALSFDRAPEVQREMLKVLPSFKHPSAKAAYQRVLQAAKRSPDSSLQKFAQSLP